MKKIVLLFVFISSFCISNAQNFEWAKGIGASGNDIAYATIYDSLGNIYSTGCFSGTVDFDSGPGTFSMTSSGFNDIFILKLNTNGDFIWAKSIGGLHSEEGKAIALDNLGNIIISANYFGSLDLDPGPGILSASNLGSFDICILKLDPLGNLIWGKTFNGADNEVAYSLVLDDSNNVYFAGTYNSTVDFDPSVSIYNLTETGAGSDLFVAKLDVAGNFVWAKSMGSLTQGEECYGMAIDANSNVYLTGLYGGSADFDPGPGTAYLTGLGSWDIFIVKLDSFGNYIWAKNVSTTGSEFGNALAIDDSGNVCATGFYSNTADFDPGPGVYNLSSNGGWDVFLLKLDASGNFIFAKSFGGTGNDEGHDLTMDIFGNTYIVGRFSGTVDFDPGIGTYTLSAAAANDIFIQKLDPLGNFIWANRVGGTASSFAYSINVNSSGNIYYAGCFGSAIDFDIGSGTTILNNAGGNDIFISKWSQGLCSNLVALIDSISSVTCTLDGFASGHALNGYPPYSYSWNTSPISNSDSAFFSGSGIYNLIVTDSIGCSKSTTFLLDGPTSQTAFDLNSNLVMSTLRPGYTTLCDLNVFNSGCIPVTGDVIIELDSSVSFISSIPPPDNIIGDSLFWNLYSMVYSSVHFTPAIKLQVSPTLLIGDTLCFDVYTSPLISDADTLNNNKHYCLPLRAAYDPNDKQVYPLGNCIPGYITNDQKLTYTVRFQNTGNADAINIYVLDTLDTDLNLSTLKVVGNSDPLITEILPGNVIKFRFDNIYLPDSTSNEEESHGYVVFEISPLSGLANGTQIKNDVGIYFDFNPPIYTNSVLNTINDGTLNSLVTTTSLIGTTLTAVQTEMIYQWIDCNTGDSLIGETNQTFNITANGNYAVIISDGCLIDTSVCVNFTATSVNDYNNSYFSIFPNPSQSNIYIVANTPTEIYISNMLGEIVLISNVTDKSEIDISFLQSGVYFITNKKGVNMKFIKQ